MIFSFFFYSYAVHRALHSLPTRRSSDLGGVHDGAAPLPGTWRVPAARARDADVRADVPRRGPLPAVLRAQPDQHLRGADPDERGVQPRLRDLDSARLLLLDPARGRGGRGARRREPVPDPAAGHA